MAAARKRPERRAKGQKPFFSEAETEHMLGMFARGGGKLSMLSIVGAHIMTNPEAMAAAGGLLETLGKAMKRSAENMKKADEKKDEGDV